MSRNLSLRWPERHFSDEANGLEISTPGPLLILLQTVTSQPMIVARKLL